MLSWGQWKPYVPVAQRRANALRQMDKLRKKGKDIQPVTIEGRTIARSFWGKSWCDHLESFSDFENRLPRGRTYVRNGSVCHLAMKPRRVEAIVSGSELYNIRIDIKKLNPTTWETVKKNCSGRIGSMLELLRGRVSDQVMAVVTDREAGLFPQMCDIEMRCNCPDWAVMCKHVAAVLYGIGSRLDSQPELLFLLRHVDAQELISTEMAVPSTVSSGNALDDDKLGDIFGIDLDVASETQLVPETASGLKRRRAGRRVGSTITKKKPRSTPRQKSPPIPVQSIISEKARHKAAAPKKLTRTTINNRTQVRIPAVPKIRPTGKSVARLRRQLKLSTADFAKRLDVSAASVYRWESATGRLKLRSRPLAALANLQQLARKR